MRDWQNRAVHRGLRRHLRVGGPPPRRGGVRTVGVDYLSVAGFHDDGVRIHRILLEAGIWLIEGLDLSAVRAGRYEMICLPVKMHESDGAPARALLRPLDG